jgi:hypothetical protein
MLLSPFAFPYFYPVFYYECSDTGCQTFFLQPLVGTTVFSSLSSLLIFLENDFMKNKSAVRCSFSYFLGLFSKAFFILLHRRCDSSACFRAPVGTSGGRFKGKRSAVSRAVGYADRSEAASALLMPFLLSGAFSEESNEISAKTP